MLSAIGRIAVRRARAILVLTVVVVLGGAALAVGGVGRMKPGGFTDPASQSEVTKRKVAAFGGEPSFVFLVRARTGNVDSPPVARAGQALTRRLAAEPSVSLATSYWTTGVPSLRARDGRSGLILVSVRGDDAEAVNRTAKLVRRYSVGPRRPGPVEVRAGGETAVYSEITDYVRRDIERAQAVAIPVSAVLLVLVFGSAVAAALPLAIGAIAVVGALAFLYLVGSVADVSIFALNLTTALGLGLAVDYALLVVSRYREELTRSEDVAAAVIRTVETAGRTVVCSGAAVAIALLALALFPFYFLRSFAYAGVAVVGATVLGAVVVLPALLTLLGGRINRGRIRRRDQPGPDAGESRFWRSVATRVMARPVIAGLPVLILLLVLGLPFLRVAFGIPDDRVLPPTATGRQVGDALRQGFDTDDYSAVHVVAGQPVAAAEASGYAATLSRLPDVARVDAPEGGWVGGVRRLPAGPANLRLRTADGVLFEVVPAVEARSAAAQDLVREIRRTEVAGATPLVGGQAAMLLDQKRSLATYLPYAFGWIAVTTFVLLFFFTGSVVLPVKALVLNGLSLTAVFGAMVWIFQDGHLAGLLGFTPTATSMTMPPLMFCVAFGLSMDYEVFLLSRVKELHDTGASDRDAIAGGLARTGRIVSTAALLLAVAFFALAGADVSFIQMFGIGCGIAVLVDATLVRGVLVPAVMRLAGRANWWAPRALRRFPVLASVSDGGETTSLAVVSPVPPARSGPPRPGAARDR